MMEGISYDIVGVNAQNAAGRSGARLFAMSAGLREALAHGVHGCGLDHVGHAHFTRLPERILILSQVLLGEAVDMRVGAILGFADDRSAYSDVAKRILRIEDGQGDLRTDLHIARLYPSARRVDADFSVGVVEPYGGNLRRPVGHQGCDTRERLFGGEEVKKILGDRFRCHRRSSLNDGSRSRLDDRSSEATVAMKWSGRRSATRRRSLTPTFAWVNSQ